MINPRIHVHISRIAAQGVRIEQRVAELVHVILKILLLRGALRRSDFHFLGIDIGDALSGGKETAVAGIQAINLHRVAAGDCRRVDVLRLQLVNAHAVFPNLDFFFQHVNAVVIRRRNGPARRVNVNLHQARARGVATDLIAEIENERIVNEHRLETVRRIQDPIRLRGQAERRKVLVVVQIVPKLHRPALLRQARRAGTAHSQAGACA